jgi:pimeloyl-ACP methyl ester carboxylesterase
MLQNIDISLPHIQLAALSNVETIRPEEPVLIFLHGYLDNANSFAGLIPKLEKYQCLAIDMAGHGRSQHRSEDAHYHLVDYAYDLSQVVKHLNLTKVFIVGHSLGGIVCSIYAATAPSALCGFVAIESCGPLSELETSTATQIQACFESREKATKAIKHPKSMQQLIAARCAVSDLNEQEAQQILSRNVVSTSRLMWRTDKRLRTKSSFRFTENQALNILESIKCRRIVILGSRGFSKVKDAISLRQSGFNKVDIVTFDGGHHVHMSAVEDVASCINRFISDILDN